MSEGNPRREPGAAAPSTARPAPMVRRGLRARVFAFGLVHAADADARLYGARKRALFGRAIAGLSPTPTVVEIGAGAGVNAAYLPAGTRWLVAEPNVYFHPHLRRAAATHGLGLTLLSGDAHALPLADASADVVVSTLVLCSVADPALALAEARRVLRPGGAFVFVEHVAAPDGTALHGAQRLLRAPWGWAADGCRPDRHTLHAIRAAGFHDVESESFRVPLALAAPHIAGIARA